MRWNPHERHRYWLAAATVGGLVWLNNVAAVCDSTLYGTCPAPPPSAAAAAAAAAAEADGGDGGGHGDDDDNEENDNDGGDDA